MRVFSTSGRYRRTRAPSLRGNRRSRLMNKPHRALLSLLVAGLLACDVAGAQPVCLPSSLFPRGEDVVLPTLDLGLVANVPTLCAHNDPDKPGLLGCWTIDAKTGALGASTATSLPGHSQRAQPDAKGCIEGYCVPPVTDPGQLLLWAGSTDGTHTVILRERTLHVFERKTKSQTALIPLDDPKAPANTNVSNEPIKILYAADTIYVVGSDAGPFSAVWPYKQDGRRLGVITRAGNPRGQAFSVFNGGVNLIDDRHISLIDAGLQSMLTLAASNGARQRRSRSVSSAPCTRKEMESINLGELDQLTPQCRKTAEARFEPYFDLLPVKVPSGDLLAALAGTARGSLALLDGKTLNERQRFSLPRCPH